MTTDRELLELAAKAAGWDETRIDENGWFYVCTYPGEPREWELWNPLLDDGDALRLAVKLSIDVLFRFVGGQRCEALAPGGPVITESFDAPGCNGEATRLAIVRAAAAIGKAGA